MRLRIGRRSAKYTDAPAARRRGAPVLSYARVRCRMRALRSHAVKRETGSAIVVEVRSTCAVPANGKRPADFMVRACVSMSLSAIRRWEGEAHEAVSPDTGRMRGGERHGRQSPVPRGTDTGAHARRNRLQSTLIARRCRARYVALHDTFLFRACERGFPYDRASSRGSSCAFSRGFPCAFSRGFSRVFPRFARRRAMNAPMKRLAVGIGCKRGASVEQIEAAVLNALGPHSIDDIRAVVTIDIKAHEPGIVGFCARHALPLQVFSREQIAAASGSPAAGQTSAPSPHVRAHLGVDGVCEPCALLAAPAGRLIAPKRVFEGGVTVAIATADATADSVAHATVGREQTQTQHQQHHQEDTQ
jgi:cobalt-precorrin 5A hydrolase